MTGDVTRCPFCAEQVNPGVPVCRACGRDIAIPAHLRAEHAELTRRRDQLKRDVESAKAGIASRARRSESR